MAMMN
jgi:hypothetical protein